MSPSDHSSDQICITFLHTTPPPLPPSGEPRLFVYEDVTAVYTFDINAKFIHRLLRRTVDGVPMWASRYRLKTNETKRPTSNESIRVGVTILLWNLQVRHLRAFRQYARTKTYQVRQIKCILLRRSYSDEAVA